VTTEWPALARNGAVPVEPEPSTWAFPPADTADRHGVVLIGADLEPGTLLDAYRRGMFPMPVNRRGITAWWSPDPRGVLPLDGLRVTRSLRQSCRRFEIRVDTAFAAVMEGCRDPRRDGGWISADIIRAYRRLHQMGWAHSVEAWTLDGRLAGGLYGVGIGGFFAGESMFHTERDASKVALVGLVDLLRDAGAVLLDVQWKTEHLASLGAVDIPRREYLRRLADAVTIDAKPFAGY
jgi:leucyl/phenylalanyl-tRNA--protein transferase